MSTRLAHRIALASALCLAATLSISPGTASAAPATATDCEQYPGDEAYPYQCLMVIGNGTHIDRITLTLNLGDNRPVCATPDLRTISPDGTIVTDQPMAQVCGNAPLVINDYQLVAGHDYPDGETIGSNFREYEITLPWTGVKIRA
jgi:hypothetical protein